MLMTEDVAKARENIENARAGIDILDENLVKILAQRFELVMAIGEIKKELKISALDPARRKKKINHFVALGNEFSIEQEFMIELYTLIHAYSVHLETQ